MLKATPDGWATTKGLGGGALASMRAGGIEAVRSCFWVRRDQMSFRTKCVLYGGQDNYRLLGYLATGVSPLTLVTTLIIKLSRVGGDYGGLSLRLVTSAENIMILERVKNTALIWK